MESTPNLMTPPVQLIVVDLDGTLLNSQHEMSERNEKALKDAMARGVHVVIATGKTRVSAQAIIERLELTTPGIYLQGLAVYRPDGTTVFQKTLDPAIARQVLTITEAHGYSTVAYSGSRLLVRALTPDVEQLATRYDEPMPEVVSSLQNILDEIPVNKLLVIKSGQPDKITALRRQLDRMLDGNAQLTQALADMVEILPPGGSKATALAVLLQQMNIAAEHVLAIGDGENDLGMVQMAGIGVAMANADPKLKNAADQVVASNDDDGVAEAVERFVLGAREAQ